MSSARAAIASKLRDAAAALNTLSMPGEYTNGYTLSEALADRITEIGDPKGPFYNGAQATEFGKLLVIEQTVLPALDAAGIIDTASAPKLAAQTDDTAEL